MSHLALRLSFSLPCLLFLAAIALLRPPMFDDPDLHTLLIPPTDCAAPCFMGIRPGVTALDTAVGNLEASPQAESVNVVSLFASEQVVKASVSLPSGRLQLLLDARDSVIRTITVSSVDFPLREVVLALGQSASNILKHTTDARLMTYVSFYPQYLMIVTANLPVCSLDMSLFWVMPRMTSIQISTPRDYAKQAEELQKSALLSSSGWMNQILAMKHTSCPPSG